jgi:hypothetical protein
MTKAKVLVYLLFLFCFSINAQNNTDSLRVNFKVNFNKIPLELHKQYVSSTNDTLALETFKCYISAIQIQYADKSVFVEKNSYHLLDSENPSSLSIPITQTNDKHITKISFSIGIDSLTSNSGALNGDLDPTKGMYWAWQSGYINMKLEGKSPSCKTRKNQFHFHIGGYLKPYYAMRKVVFDVNTISNINIGIDLAKFFSAIDLSQTNSIMIPGKQAMQLADVMAKLFYIE